MPRCTVSLAGYFDPLHNTLQRTQMLPSRNSKEWARQSHFVIRKCSCRGADEQGRCPGQGSVGVGVGWLAFPSSSVLTA